MHRIKDRFVDEVSLDSIPALQDQAFGKVQGSAEAQLLPWRRRARARRRHTSTPVEFPVGCTLHPTLDLRSLAQMSAYLEFNSLRVIVGLPVPPNPYSAVFGGPKPHYLGTWTLRGLKNPKQTANPKL